MYETKITGVTGGSAIPVPKGYKILVAIPEVAEKTKGGVIRPDQLRKDEGLASVFGYVVGMGEDCYTGDKFPNGAWCAAGDFVMFRSYSGTRFKVRADDNTTQEFRLINDDMVEAVIEDPSKIERA